MKIGEIKKQILKRNPGIEEELRKDLAFQVGRMLVNARLTQKMTQEALAKKTGTKQPAIARIESGSNLPNLSLLDKIAKAFGSYLIPPRFAFMKQEDFFTGSDLIREKNIESGTLTKDIKQSNLTAIPSYFNAKNIRTDSKNEAYNF